MSSDDGYGPPTMKEYLSMPESMRRYGMAASPACSHEWETGSWGVIVGVSRCKKCGLRSRESDFPKPEARP